MLTFNNKEEKPFDNENDSIQINKKLNLKESKSNKNGKDDLIKGENNEIIESNENVIKINSQIKRKVYLGQILTTEEITVVKIRDDSFCDFFGPPPGGPFKIKNFILNG